MTKAFRLIPMIAWVGTKVTVAHAVCYRLIIWLVQRDAHKCVQQLDKQHKHNLGLREVVGE